MERVGEYLDGRVWVEERSMLQAKLVMGGASDAAVQTFHALNDVVVGRSALSRLVHLEVHIDGAPLTTYRADAVIVATATGSTGYSISAGGPILHPQSRDLLLNPVATHLGLHTPLVLSPDSNVEVALRSDYQAMLSVDGRMDMALEPGTVVHYRQKPLHRHLPAVRPSQPVLRQPDGAPQPRLPLRDPAGNVLHIGAKLLDEPTIESRRIYDGRIIGVRVDTIRLPDGGTSQREIVEHGASVRCRAGGRAWARDPGPAVPQAA